MKPMMATSLTGAAPISAPVMPFSQEMLAAYYQQIMRMYMPASTSTDAAAASSASGSSSSGNAASTAAPNMFSTADPAAMQQFFMSMAGMGGMGAMGGMFPGYSMAAIQSAMNAAQGVKNEDEDEDLDEDEGNCMPTWHVSVKRAMLLHCCVCFRTSANQCLFMFMLHALTFMKTDEEEEEEEVDEEDELDDVEHEHYSESEEEQAPVRRGATKKTPAKRQYKRRR